MAARIGIELSPVTCRIIELEDAASRSGHRAATRVTSFSSLPLAELAPANSPLASLRGRHASVVVWTSHSSYRQVEVPSGPYDRMRAAAVRVAAPTGVSQTPLLCDIAPAAPFSAGMPRRAVLLASVPRTEIAEAIRPLKEAGIKVDAILTPASALTSLARLRRGLSPAGALEAYLAIEETASTLALVSDGYLLAARTASWGYLSELPSRYSVRPRPREEITMRLAEDIAACLASVQADPRRLTQVCVCGGLPELRNMTLPLLERLDIEVEPLDTLFGIDPSRLPDPGGEFQERAAAFRLAWAAAADDDPLLDFVRERRRYGRKVLIWQGAVAAGVVAGLGAGWILQGQWRPAVRPVRSVAENATVPAPRLPTARPTVQQQPPPAAIPVPAPRVPEPAALQFQSAQSAQSPAPTAAQPRGPAIATPPAAATPSIATPAAAPAPPIAPPARKSVEPAATPPPVRPPATLPATAPATASGPTRPAPARPASAPATTPARPASAQRTPTTARASTEAAATARAAQLEPPARPSESAPPPLPFDAALGTILYGPERKLAIVDGRIVQAGDDVRGAIVVEITPTSVYLRDAEGRLRRLTAGGTGR